MAKHSVILTSEPVMSYTGDKFRGDGFYGFNDGLHTVSFHVKQFTGRIFLQATLMDDPKEEDWFNISLMVDQEFLQWGNETETLGVTFIGNFVYIRAKVDRSYLVDQEYSAEKYGVVDKVVLMI